MKLCTESKSLFVHIFFYTAKINYKKGDDMYTVQPICKFIIILAAAILELVVFLLTFSFLVIVVAVVIEIWLFLYLDKLKIELKGEYIIKHTGRLISRKLIINIKNIYTFHAIIFFPSFPAMIKINYHERSVILWGLNGRQVKKILESII